MMLGVNLGLLFFGGVAAANDLELRYGRDDAKSSQLWLEFDLTRAVDALEFRLTGTPTHLETQKTTLNLKQKYTGLKPGTKRWVYQEKCVSAYWAGKVEVIFSDGARGEMPLSFESECPRTLVLNVPKEKLDLKSRVLTFEASEPIRWLELLLWLDGTEKALKKSYERLSLQRGEIRFADRVQEKDHEKIVRIDLKATSSSGAWSSYSLLPWKVEIPHQDVFFESASSRVPEGEKEKIVKAKNEIQRTLKRNAQALQLDGLHFSLWIVGHTDRVGTTQNNLKLSKARASALGQGLRDAGLRLPIHVCGVGEGQPRVQTRDEVGEARNRRADYILSSEQPSGFPECWSTLP